jgi:integrase
MAQFDSYPADSRPAEQKHSAEIFRGPQLASGESQAGLAEPVASQVRQLSFPFRQYAVLRSVPDPSTLPPRTGAANSTATRRKSLSRRIIVSAGNAEPEIRQRGYVYQKGRKKSDPWIPSERAYGYFREDVPGQTKQKEVRIALGFHRDRDSAKFKLHDRMKEMGVLDAQTIRERISPSPVFRPQAAWMIAEMRAGRIVNKKTRKRIRERTIEGYSTAVNYLNTVIGDKPLALLDNPEAKALIEKMKSEPDAKRRRRFSDKTISEYFKVFQMVIASARGDRLNQLYTRQWDLATIGVPKVCADDQHRPTFEADELASLLSKVKPPIYKLVGALLAGTGMRISELLALEVGKHISADCEMISVVQQRGSRGTLEPPKTKAGVRRIHLAAPLAKMLREYIASRKAGFLFETNTGRMISPGDLWRDGFKTIVNEMGLAIRFHSFRRFRESVLQASECRQLVIDYWMGHENADMSFRYGKQLLSNKTFLAKWADKVGLGFEIPASNPGLSAIRAIRNQDSVVAA